MLQQSSILSDLDSLINADVHQVTVTQDQDQVVETANKKRKIDESSTSSPAPKKTEDWK